MDKHDTDGEGLQLAAGFDRGLIHRRGGSARYLVARVAAPAWPKEKRRQRIPLNFAVVIDVSGSMQGDRIASAKEAARGIIECLHDDDLLTLVSFDSDVNLHVPGLPLDDAVRGMALERITQMQAGSMTNLSGGWMQGAECLSEAMAQHPGGANRLILLTDGHANQGVTDPVQLENLAERYRELGIYSSAVGIGDDYSSEQIEAIASYGGGTLHDAEHPHEIVEVVTAELREAFEVFADDIELRIEGADGAQYEGVGPFPAGREGNGICIALGSLLYGRSRDVVVRMFLPRGEPGEELPFCISAVCRRPGRQEADSVSHPPLTLTFARDAELQQQSRHEERAQTVMKAWHAEIIREAVRLNRSRDRSRAAAYVGEQLHHFRCYVPGLQGADEKVAELERLVHRISMPMRERSRKEVILAMRKQLYKRQDQRRTKRRTYDRFLFDDEGQ
jgi:Ca-activated chloride channel family protein